MGWVMAKLTMIYIGMKDGMRAYAAMDAEDEKVINDQNIIVCEAKGERSKRTALQNKSIHKYCSLLAEQFNDAGLDMQAVLERKSVPVSWTMDSVKDVIWRPIQLAMYQKESTTQLEKKEVSKIYEQIARHLSEQFNIVQSFPNRHGS